MGCLRDLVEANHVGVLTEALTAGVESVLADDGLLVAADAAAARTLAHVAGDKHLLAGTPLLEMTHAVRRGACL